MSARWRVRRKHARAQRQKRGRQWPANWQRHSLSSHEEIALNQANDWKQSAIEKEAKEAKLPESKIKPFLHEVDCAYKGCKGTVVEIYMAAKVRCPSCKRMFFAV